MPICARLRHAADTRQGSKKYVDIKRLITSPERVFSAVQLYLVRIFDWDSHIILSIAALPA